jgi:hypothetical protein
MGQSASVGVLGVCTLSFGYVPLWSWHISRKKRLTAPRQSAGLKTQRQAEGMKSQDVTIEVGTPPAIEKTTAAAGNVQDKVVDHPSSGVTDQASEARVSALQSTFHDQIDGRVKHTLVLVLPFEEENTKLLKAIYPPEHQGVERGSEFFRDAMLGIRSQAKAQDVSWGLEKTQSTRAASLEHNKFLLKRDRSISIIRSSACMVLNEGYSPVLRRRSNVDSPEEMKRLMRKKRWQAIFLRLRCYVELLHLLLLPYERKLLDKTFIAKNIPFLCEYHRALMEHKEEIKRCKEIAAIGDGRDVFATFIGTMVPSNKKKAVWFAKTLKAAARMRAHLRQEQDPHGLVASRVLNSRKKDETKQESALGMADVLKEGAYVRWVPASAGDRGSAFTYEKNSGVSEGEICLCKYEPKELENDSKEAAAAAKDLRSSLDAIFGGMDTKDSALTVEELVFISAEVKCPVDTDTAQRWIEAYKRHIPVAKQVLEGQGIPYEHFCQLMKDKLRKDTKHERVKIITKDVDDEASVQGTTCCGLIRTEYVQDVRQIGLIMINHTFTTFLILLATFISVFLGTTEGFLFDEQEHGHWTQPVSLACSIFFLVEVLVRMSLMTFCGYLSDWTCVLDLVVTIIDWVSWAVLDALANKAEKTTNALDTVIALRFLRLIRLWRLYKATKELQKLQNSVQKHLPYLTTDEHSACSAIEREFRAGARGNFNDVETCNLLLAKAIRDRLRHACGFHVAAKIMKKEPDSPKVVCLYISASTNRYENVATAIGYNLQLLNRPHVPEREYQTRDLLQTKFSHYSSLERGDHYLDFHLFENDTQPQLLKALRRWKHVEGVTNDNDVGPDDIYFSPFMKFLNDKAFLNLYRTYDNSNPGTTVTGHNQTCHICKQTGTSICEEQGTSRRERLTHGDKIKLTLAQLDRHLNLSHLLQSVCVDYYFPHDEDRKQELYQVWAKKLFFSFHSQPAKMLFNYFGSDVAFYFVWLGEYNKNMIFPACLGFLVFVVQTVLYSMDTMGQSTAAETSRMCNVVGLNVTRASNATHATLEMTAVVFRKQLHSALMFLYVIFVSWWTVKFHEHWGAVQAKCELQFYGEVIDRNNKDETAEKRKTRPNPHFKGVLRRNPVTDDVEKYYDDKTVAKCDRVCSTSIIGTLMFVVIISGVSIILFKQFMQRAAPGWEFTAGCVNGVVMVLFDAVWRSVATRMTHFENHITVEEYQDALITKIFVFSFINSYAPLLYVVFVESFRPCDCTPKNDCVRELEVTLYTIVVTRLTLQNVLEFYSDDINRLVQKLLSVCRCKKSSKEKSEEFNPSIEDEVAAQTRQELLNPPYSFSSQFGNFNEIAINHGYWVLFAAVFPIGSLMFLFVNFVEIYLDAGSMCKSEEGTFRRPDITCANSVNVWKQIVNIVSYIGFFTNAFILVFVSRTFQAYSYSEKVSLFLTLVIGLYTIRWLSTLTRSSDHELARILGERFKFQASRLQSEADVESRRLGDHHVVTDKEFENREAKRRLSV